MEGRRQGQCGVADVRLIEAPGLNFAHALNLALREARYPLVARMDADDVSIPGRFEAQAAYLVEHPEIAVVGTAFDRIDDDGRVIETCRPATDPREVRWRMLVENCVTHGSVMMRRDAVLEVGGYEGSCEKAQDFDLWLRLMERRGAVVANLPEVLYQYRCGGRARDGSGWQSSPEQASVAAAALLRAWAALPDGSDDADLHRAMSRVLSEPGGGAWMIERLLTEGGATRARLQAWAWARHVRSAVPMGAVEAGRAALLREAGRSIRAARTGVAPNHGRGVWLWGAGRHTAWVMAHGDDLGMPVIGIVDDHAHGTVAHGYHVVHPAELDDSCDVLLSSDTQEDAMWASSVSARARGVRVWRLYSPAFGGAALRAGAAA